MDPASTSNRRLLWFCLFTAAFVLFAYCSRAFTAWGNGDGLTLQPALTPFMVKVSNAQGPAAAAGIRAGDMIDSRTVPMRVRGGVRTSLSSVTVKRNRRSIALNIVPAPPRLAWEDRGRFLAEMWAVLFAALIAWRAKKWASSAPLAMILALNTLGDAMSNAVVPWSALTDWLHALGLLMFGPLTFVLLANYFGRFGSRSMRSRTLWTRIVYAAAVLSTLAAATHDLATGTMWLAPDYERIEFTVFEVALTSPILPCLVCGMLAARASGRAEAQRVGWVAVSFGLFWLFWILAGPLGALGSASTGAVVWRIETAAHLLVPLGLTYAALSRRLFDIGFAVNRAAVFTAVSTIVIGSFVIFEWAIGKWFEGVSHATSLTLNVALALVLGLSLRFMHHRVDRFVDTVFFRKRHENERALRRFGHEAMLMTRRDALLERAVSEILRHSEASSASMIPAGSLDLNDPAMLALRAWNEPVELARYETSLAGEYAFPMIAHGELIGAIVCGPKKNEERYAPDEIDALKELAHGVGLAYWSLEEATGRNDISLEILAEIRSLRRTLSAPQT